MKLSIGLLIGLVLSTGVASNVEAKSDSRPSLGVFSAYATQKTGGNLTSGGADWTPRLFSLSIFDFGALLGTQVLRDSEGEYVPTVDLGVTLGTRFGSAFRVQAEATILNAPLEGNDLFGILLSSAPTIGCRLAYDRSFLFFDGLWVGYRQWLVADSVTEFRAGVSFDL